MIHSSKRTTVFILNHKQATVAPIPFKLAFLWLAAFPSKQGFNSMWVELLCSLSELCIWDDHIRNVCSTWLHTEPRREKKTQNKCLKPELSAQRDYVAKSEGSGTLHIFNMSIRHCNTYINNGEKEQYNCVLFTQVLRDLWRSTNIQPQGGGCEVQTIAVVLLFTLSYLQEGLKLWDSVISSELPKKSRFPKLFLHKSRVQSFSSGCPEMAIISLLFWVLLVSGESSW